MRDCGVEHVLISCMRNGAAVMRSAVALAPARRNISRCAPDGQSLIPALDDSYCAAALLRHGELVRAEDSDLARVGHDRAQHRVGVRRDREAFDQSMSAASRRISSPDDVGYCAEENVSELVPVASFSTGVPAIVVKKETKG